MIHPGTKRRHRFVAALSIVGGLVAAVGCDYVGIPAIDNDPITTPHLGTICSVSTDNFSPTEVTVNTESAVCPSRICLRPNEQVTTETAALCTQRCNSDDDCQGGVARKPGDSTDHACAGGFACRVPVPKLSDVSVACQKLCVCKDFLDPNQPATSPAGCP